MIKCQNAFALAKPGQFLMSYRLRMAGQSSMMDEESFLMREGRGVKICHGGTNEGREDLKETWEGKETWEREERGRMSLSS